MIQGIDTSYLVAAELASHPRHAASFDLLSVWTMMGTNCGWPHKSSPSLSMWSLIPAASQFP